MKNFQVLLALLLRLLSLLSCKDSTAQAWVELLIFVLQGITQMCGCPKLPEHDFCPEMFNLYGLYTAVSWMHALPTVESNSLRNKEAAISVELSRSGRGRDGRGDN